MSAPAPRSAPASIAVIGAGPRAVGVLERLAANLDELAPAGPLVIHLIDPYPAGPGRIWRAEQSPLLKLNSMAADVTMFTDETSTIEGPVQPGPSLIEWAEEVRAGRIELRPTDVDPRLRAEIEHLLPASFPTRRLQSLYLRWFYRRAVEALGDRAEVREHRALAREVAPAADGARRILLDTGETLDADLVLYSLGHTGVQPEPEHDRLIDFARRRELYYLPPAYTADADTRAIVPGQRVLVRGFGLAAVDLVVLLTEGRGGRFESTPEGLRYRASGREPRIVIGSRRGVPYHSKIGSTLVGEPPAARFFTPATATALERDRAQLDFAADVWPLIAQEMLWGYYRELFTGHPERVRLGWAEFAERFERLDPRAAIVADAPGRRDDGRPGSHGHAVPTWPAADQERIRADAALLGALIEESVIDEIDRLYLPALDRPLAGHRFTGVEAVHEAVRDYVERDLRLRTLPEHSATLGLFIALLNALFAFADLVASPKWTARSRIDDIHGWWLGYFSFIASGPPAHRLEELLALAEAGVVRFIGAGMRVEADEEHGIFRASSTSHGEVVTATALVDARLPDTSVARSDNELLRLLHGAGDALEEVARDADYAVSTGRLVVRQDDSRVLHASGGPAARSYAIGPYTNSPFVGAFSRPRTNAVSFRENDRVARALLRHLGELAAERWLPAPGAFSDRLWGEFAAQPSTR